MSTPLACPPIYRGVCYDIEETILTEYRANEVLDTALLEWVSEYAVRAYTTAGSAVSYLNHARIA